MNLKQQVLDDIHTLMQKNYPWLNHSALERYQETLQACFEDQLTNRKSNLHLTASAFVFQGDRVFFIHHPYLKKCLLPAGHVEPSESTLLAAQREFLEETGFKADTSRPAYLMDVNRHEIPANPAKGEGAHSHIDFRYFLFVNQDNQPNQAELSFDLLTKEQAPSEFQPYFASQQIFVKK